jgi:hypothetical protein
MSAKSTDYTYEDLKRVEAQSIERKKKIKNQFEDENIFKRAEFYIKEHPYVDSFLSSAQGYEVLITFMIDFSKSERKL